MLLIQIALLFLFVWSQPAVQASLSLTLNYTVPSINSNVTRSPQGLRVGEVHSWQLPDAVKECRGPLVVELWEALAVAGALPLPAGSRLCPVVAPEAVATLESPQSSSGAGWQQFLTDAGQLPVGSGGLWWDTAACGRLPYHWIVLAQGQLQAHRDGHWYLHVVKSQGSAVPGYHVRFSCDAPPAVRCPEPTLGGGPCSLRGACASTQGAKDSYGRCQCGPGWLGIGCEAQIPIVAPDVQTALTPFTDPAARLARNASGASSGWSLVQLQVPPASQHVVLELEVDWSSVQLPTDPSAVTAHPQLCYTNATNATIKAAFAQGRLQVAALACDPQPLHYPLDFRTSLSIPINGSASAGVTIYVVVLDIGSGYPVSLRAAVEPEGTEATCPFGCSGHLTSCGLRTCSCERAGMGYGGRMCQYYYNDLRSFTTFAEGRTIDSQEISLPPGQSAWWVVFPMPPPLVDPAELPMAWRSRRSFAISWTRGSSQRYGVRNLEVQAYRLTALPTDVYGMLNKKAAPAALCWQTTTNGDRFDPTCVLQGMQYQMAVLVRNAGQTSMQFRLRIGRYQSHSPAGLHWGGIFNYVPAAVSVTLAIVSAYLWNKRRQLAAEAAARRHRRTQTVLAAADGASLRGVPADVISTFPTKPYAPPSSKAAAAATGDRAAQAPPAAQQQLVALVALAPAQRDASPAMLHVVVEGGRADEGQAASVPASRTGPDIGTAGRLPEGSTMTAEAPPAVAQPSDSRSPAAVAGLGVGGLAPAAALPNSAAAGPAAAASAAASAASAGTTAAGAPPAGSTPTGAAQTGAAQAQATPAAPAGVARGGVDRAPASAPTGGADAAVAAAPAAAEQALAAQPVATAASGSTRAAVEDALGLAFRRVTRALSSSWAGAASTPETTDDEACPICLVDYEAGDLLRWLPCSHAFHQPCIDTWMASNHTCPVCRLDLLPPAQEGIQAPATTPTVTPAARAATTTIVATPTGTPAAPAATTTPAATPTVTPEPATTTTPIATPTGTPAAPATTSMPAATPTGTPRASPHANAPATSAISRQQPPAAPAATSTTSATATGTPATTPSGRRLAGPASSASQQVPT